jgi:hypothetical protein
LDGSVLKSSLDIQARERRRKAFRSKKKILNQPFLIGLHTEERESRSRLAWLVFFVVGTRHSSWAHKWQTVNCNSNNGLHFLSLLFTGNWPRANQDKFFFSFWLNENHGETRCSWEQALLTEELKKVFSILTTKRRFEAPRRLTRQHPVC